MGPVNLGARQRRAERIAGDPEVLPEWLEADFPQQGGPRPGAEAAHQAIARASVSIPRAQESWQALQRPGRYREFHVTLDLLSPGFHGIHAVGQVVAFEAWRGQAALGPCGGRRPRRAEEHPGAAESDVG